MSNRSLRAGFAAAVAVVAMAAGLLPATASTHPPGPDGDPFEDGTNSTGRIEAADPVAAGVAVSRIRFADQAAPFALVSRDDQFADSLAAAPLSGDGPLLFTPTGALAPGTAAELQRVVGQGPAYLLGGVGAISAAVEAEIQSLGVETRRLSGPSRVETAIAVADELRRLNGPGTRLALARADGPEGNPTAAWADSVTGGAWAAQTAVPLLVTGSTELHPAVAAALERHGVTETVLLGGTAALSEAVADAVPGGQRISGSDRAATATSIAEQLWGPQDRYLLFNGFHADGWAYGLAAAGLAADRSAPLLMVNIDSVPPATRDLLDSRGGAGAVETVAVGGTEQIPSAVLSSLDGPAEPGEGPAGTTCFTTPANTVVDEHGTAVDRPQADIVEVCMTNGDEIVLAVRVVEPVDPEAPGEWGHAWRYFEEDRPSRIDFVVESSSDPPGAEPRRVTVRGTGSSFGPRLTVWFDGSPSELFASFEGDFIVARFPAVRIGAPHSFAADVTYTRITKTDSGYDTAIDRHPSAGGSFSALTRDPADRPVGATCVDGLPSSNVQDTVYGEMPMVGVHIAEFCVGNGPEAVFAIRMANPSSPYTDDSWQSLDSKVTFGVSTSGALSGDPDRWVEVRRSSSSPDALSVQVYDKPEDQRTDDSSAICHDDQGGEYAGGFIVARVPTSAPHTCLGATAPTTISANAIYLYHSQQPSEVRFSVHRYPAEGFSRP